MNTHLDKHEGADLCCRSQPSHGITVNTDHQLQEEEEEEEEGEEEDDTR